MLNPRVHLARLLCKQVRCGGVPPPIRMVAPASLHLQPKLPTPGGSCRSFSLWDGMGVWERADELMSKLANADGTINLVQRVAGFKLLLKAWKDFCCWVQPQQQDHAAFQELGQEVVAGLEKMFQTANNKLSGKMSALQAEIQPHMYELFVKLVIYQLVAGCSASQYRFVAGVPSIFCWKGVSILQSLSERMRNCEIPTEFRPVLQPMGDVDVDQLQQSAFSKVLQVAAADAKWQTLLTSDRPIIQDIRRLKEQWAPSAPSMATDLLGVGVVRRVLNVKDARHVASHAGDLYVHKYNNDGWLVRYDGVGDQVSFRCVDMSSGMAIGDAMEGDGCMVVSGGFWRSHFVSVGSVSETHHVIMEDWRQHTGFTGFSLTGSHAYFCSGHRHQVYSLDMETKCIRPLIGQVEVPGCSDSKRPSEQLLRNPTDTAVFSRRLFIADAGNQRVLCFDRKKNECRVVFEGMEPRHIAAYHSGLFVYDHGQHKIFHVTMDTWEVRHVLGTGISGILFDSEEGLPPLSTNLRTITSMTIYRDGKLAFLYEDDPIVREFWMPSPSTPTLLPVGTVCASHVKLFQQGQDDEKDALLPLQGPDLQPPLPTHFQPFSEGSMPMCLSETLPGDKNKFIFSFKLGRPTHGLGICLVTETSGPSNSKPVDCHMFSPIEWNAQTHVTTLSKMREQAQLDNQPFRKLWKKAIDAFHTVVMNADTAASLAKPFCLEDENYFKVEVERTYDADAHSFTWKLVKVYVKAESWMVRAESLDELTVGVAVPVRICLFAAIEDGCLEFLDEPRLTVFN